MPLDHLESIKFFNTNLTKEAIKIIKKRYRPRFISVNFMNHARFDHLALVKECSHYRVGGRRNEGLVFAIVKFDIEKQFFFMNHVSKI
jgi:hypothetical protein